MRFSSVLPVFALITGLTSADPTDEDVTLEARDAGGIGLVKLDLGKGKSYTGVGKPAYCYNLPYNIKYFNLYSDKTKSLVGCFDCRVYTGTNCQGSYVSLEGQEKAFLTKGGKKPHYKSWKCKCKEEW
ncbi:hypothetical protein FLAG1_09868 [Fusarium langsethiae]|uniref:Uncharacterized protein n=1 Tax=Fusarium langsethiae TaxID=179993 RepID=A0A0N0DBV7_FUSLA|nr:hypothetical protein FLAG1_09868 [Fusarium langsethiae]GKU06986.1 unnamed protein product [Fusarium langsethiae]GKU22261.1 unnamed protein product [Fusarium langsethiae]